MTRSTILALIATIIFAVIAVVDLLVKVSLPHEIGWVAVGLGFFAAAHIV